MRKTRRLTPWLSNFTMTALKFGTMEEGSSQNRTLTPLQMSQKAAKKTLVKRLESSASDSSSVFKYTDRPKVYSGEYSFAIRDFVSPEAVPMLEGLGSDTLFIFPLGNLKKSEKDAGKEIRTGLEELAESTLLFLSNIKSIRWLLGQEVLGEVLRIQHSETLITVTKNASRKAAVTSHYLRFDKSVEGLKRHCVSVAFALDYLPNVTAFEPNKALEKQLKIVAANPGRVAVFFPANEENSGLRFHLHAPCVTVLSRASIKDTPTNEPLFKQLAELASASLHRIKDMNLLTVDFLGVLPNQQETIPPRYESIRKAIIDEMNNQPLTPTHSKSYAPAKHLLQANKTSFKDLLSAEDIKILVNQSEGSQQWAIGPTQKNSYSDRFLSGLAIRKWDIAEFVGRLEEKATVETWREADANFMAWLAAKPVVWHQQMYALLYADLPTTPQYKRKQAIDLLKSLQIIRLGDGDYSVGSNCYFPSDGVEHDEILPRVAKGLYSSGKDKTQQEDARKLLEEIGVREVGETEEVQGILQKRYTAQADAPDDELCLWDLQRFIDLVEKEPGTDKLFSDFYFLKRADEKWAQPSQTYLDSPFLETGLSAYYEALGAHASRAALAHLYQQVEVPIEKLRKFAEKIGVQVQLEIEHVSCENNPAVRDLVWRAPGNRSANRINRDYTIAELNGLLDGNNEALSRLVWRTACDKKDIGWLKAKYRNNLSCPTRESASQLVCILRDSSWIPQTDGRFVRPSEASKVLLPKGFPYDEGYEWLQAIRFGEEEQKRSVEHRQKQTTAKELGFADADTLELALKFAALPRAEQEHILAEFQRRQDWALPEREPRNSERRSEHVRQQAADALERTTEQRTRSVSIGQEDVKQEAEQYLREQYRNSDGEMICQACKATLPFKLDDGSYYFEKVEFLKDLKRRHYQNYLALCPNHSAMFQHANGSRDLMKEMFVEMEIQQLEVVLAQSDATNTSPRPTLQI